MNASSQRSGRLILSQLKEATQSHQVDSQGVGAYKPTYFNSYGANGSSSVKPGNCPSSSKLHTYSFNKICLGQVMHEQRTEDFLLNLLGKVKSPRTVVSSPRKTPQSPRSAKKGGLAPTSLAKFFKMSPPTNTEPPTTTEKEEKGRYTRSFIHFFNKCTFICLTF